jgi:nucleoside-diphosphate-sugar epimerase
MIVAITGGTGFIGRELVRLHHERGDEIRVLSRRAPQTAGLPDSVRWHAGDLSAEFDARSFVANADVLYHCAGEIRDPARMNLVHVGGTARLSQAAHGSVRRWVQLSSTGAYGQRRAGEVTERSDLLPVGPYELTKVAADRLVEEAAGRGAFELAILRPSIVYGERMSNRSLFSWIATIERGLFFFIGTPGATANYIHVDNVAAALLLCARAAQVRNDIYDLSDHRTVEDFVALIADALGRKTPTLRVPERPARLLARWAGRLLPGFPLTESRVDMLTGRARYPIDKIRTELGYEHVVSMEQGIARLVQRWRERYRGAGLP